MKKKETCTNYVFEVSNNKTLTSPPVTTIIQQLFSNSLLRRYFHPWRILGNDEHTTLYKKTCTHANRLISLKLFTLYTINSYFHTNISGINNGGLLGDSAAIIFYNVSPNEITNMVDCLIPYQSRNFAEKQ